MSKKVKNLITKELGDVVIDRVKARGVEREEFGAKLTADNVDAFLSKTRQCTR